MARTRLPLFGIVLLFFTGTAYADLSGDYRLTVVDKEGKQESAQLGKIFLKGESNSPDRAMRMEIAPEGAAESEKLVFLTNPKEAAMYMVMPEAKSYMKMSMEEGETKAPKSPGQGYAGTEFKTVGRERLNGIRVIVKEAPLRDGEKTVGTMRVYVAPSLGNEPLKSVLTSDKGGSTTIAIENPKSGNLPDSLFRVPKGYTETKLPSVGEMMNQLGEGAKDDAKGEAQKEKDEAKEKAKKGIRDKLPF